MRLSTRPRIGTRTGPGRGALELVANAVVLVPEHEREASDVREIFGHERALGVRRDELEAAFTRPATAAAGLGRSTTSPTSRCRE